MARTILKLLMVIIIVQLLDTLLLKLLMETFMTKKAIYGTILNQVELSLGGLNQKTII